MYIEKRNLKGKIKYYLVYSYRKKNEVKKIRKYLGQDLTKQLLTEEFVYDTNAIEGSSVERDEVPKILHKKKVSNDEELETKGVAKAVNYIKSAKGELSIELIKKLHKICFQGSKAFAG